MDFINDYLQHWFGYHGWTVESAIKLLLAAILGGAVGIEREVRGRQAGFRTNLLVCLGSALVMLISSKIAGLRWAPTDDYNISVDPGRIAYGVMTGIGFLGAGAIMKHQDSVRGLTTAAALWCVAAIGLTVGIGQYATSVVATGLVVAALWILTFFEKRMPKRHFRKLVIRAPWRGDGSESIISRLRGDELEVVDHSFQRIGDLSQADVTIFVSYPRSEVYQALEKALQSHPDLALISSEITR